MSTTQNSKRVDGTAARQRAGRRALRLWSLTAVIAAAAGALALAVGDATAPGHHDIPWWLLLLGFAATETCVVHVHFRRSAQSLTLGEIPLVLGLLFASPVDVMWTWAVAGAVVLLATRTPLVRLAFSVALLPLTAGVAGAILHGLVGTPTGADGLGPAVWAAVALGAMLSAALGAALIGTAVRISEGELGIGRLTRMLWTAVIVATANTCLALAAAVVLEADPWAAAFLLVPAVTVYAAYRGYMGERSRHESLEFLYDAGRALTNAPDPASALVGVLARAQSTFRGEVGEALLFEAPGGEPARTTLGPGERLEVLEPVDPSVVTAVRDLLSGRASALVRRDEAPAALAAHMGAREIREAMIAPLVGDHRTAGVLIVGDRTGVGGRFSTDELRLLETLASHTGAALEQGRLGRQVDELRDLQRALEHQAFHDPLTGLANRLLFSDRVGNALARRSGNAAVMYIDLDDFKGVNDTLGHEAGDALLVAVGDRLRDALRAADTPARLGGDEFAVLLVDISEENARTVANRILSFLARPLDVGGGERPIRASLGLALGDAGTTSVEQLLRNADAAMYAAKHRGKHQLAVHRPAAVAA